MTKKTEQEGQKYGWMDIVDSFYDKKDYDNNYDNNSGHIPSNGVNAAEADATVVPQSPAFATASFLGQDIVVVIVAVIIIKFMVIKRR